MTIEITDEMVEAGAIALHDYSHKWQNGPSLWTGAPHLEKLPFRDKSRRCLEAALAAAPTPPAAGEEQQDGRRLENRVAALEKRIETMWAAMENNKNIFDEWSPKVDDSTHKIVDRIEDHEVYFERRFTEQASQIADLQQHVQALEQRTQSMAWVDAYGVLAPKDQPAADDAEDPAYERLERVAKMIEPYLEDSARTYSLAARIIREMDGGAS
jgi:hypothetical protein